MAQSSLQPLSVGNVVTTAFQLYKNRFKPYFLLALKAYFWLLVPVYGWAKFLAISALLSRLVYGELVNQPETITGGMMYVNSKLWQFLIASVLFTLIVLSVWLTLAIVSVVILTIVFLVIIGSVSSLQPSNIANTIIVAIAFSISTVGSLLFLVRLFVLELPLAIEDNINATSTIRRSWKLSKNFESHTLLISLVAFLITLPLLALFEIICSLLFRFSFGNWIIANPLIALIALVEIIRRIFQLFLDGSINQKQIFNLLSWILSLCLGAVVGAMQLPFWQAIKAVVYYELRTRKEGLGLKLRDRNI